MTPVFIGGCHRSGTTLLGALLGAHPECLTTPESQFKTDALDGRSLPGDRLELDAFIVRAKASRSLGRWHLDPGVVQLQSDQVSGYSDFIARLVRAYGESVDNTSYRFWIDHTPKNVRHLKLLFSEFPAAKAIHIVRDGRAVAASVMRLDWGPNTILPAAHWWTHHLAFGLAAETHFGEARVLRVRYEDLVTSPRSELNRICRWLEIEFDDRMEHGGGFNDPNRQFRYHELIQDAPNASRAMAWKKSLSDRQIESFESRTEDLLTYLDYELQHTAARTRNRDLLETLTIEPVKLALNTLRYRLWLFKRDRR